MDQNNGYIVFVVAGYAVDADEAGILVASWQAAEDSNVTGYLLEYGRVSSSNVVSPEDEPQEVGGRVSYTLRDLSNFTEYRVSVRTECADAEGPEDVKQVMTMATGNCTQYS